MKGILKKRSAKTKSSKRVSFAVSEKKIAQVAKAAVMKVSETRSSIRSSFLNPLDELVAAQNLVHHLTQGDTSEGHTGQEIFLKNINIRGHIQKSSSALDAIVRVMVVKSINPFTNTTILNMSPQNVFRAGGTADYNATSAHLDFNKVQVLADKQYRLVPQFSTHRPLIPVNLNIQINQNKKYQQDNSGYFKDGNYYLIVTSYDGNGISAPATFDYDWTVNYKDF